MTQAKKNVKELVHHHWNVTFKQVTVLEHLSFVSCGVKAFLNLWVVRFA